jgi:uncharacterized damage-inducible protein DinB
VHFSAPGIEIQAPSHIGFWCELMDLVDRLLGHDAWTTRELLLRCRELPDEELDREFDIGHRSVRATFLHIIFNVEVWTDLMCGEPARLDRGTLPEDRSVSGMLERQTVAAERFAGVAREVAASTRWDDLWIDVLDNPPRAKSFGGAIAHVITHSMHHRAQLLHMLRRLELEDLPEGDVLSWEDQAR